jgi:hypothetical protein
LRYFDVDIFISLKYFSVVMSKKQHQITLKLPVETLAKLEEEAAERKLTPEEVALAILRANCKCPRDEKEKQK